MSRTVIHRRRPEPVGLVERAEEPLAVNVPKARGRRHRRKTASERSFFWAVSRKLKLLRLFGAIVAA